MEKWADYCISKLTMKDGLIDTVTVYKDFGESIGDETEQKRSWMVNNVLYGKTFCSIKKKIDGKWYKVSDFSYTVGLFSWGPIIPLNLPARKTFVSYYHNDDEYYRKTFDNLFDDMVTSKSVELGDIDSDNSAEYVKQLINGEYLDDTTVLVVLIGANTKNRKHVDWEISGALSYKVGNKYAGLLGLFLPTHPSYGSDNYNKDSIPKRLQKNSDSGYAILRDWTEDRVKIQEYIELAFAQRDNDKLIVNSEIPQMKINIGE